MAHRSLLQDCLLFLAAAVECLRRVLRVVRRVRSVPLAGVRRYRVPRETSDCQEAIDLVLFVLGQRLLCPSAVIEPRRKANGIIVHNYLSFLYLGES